MINFNKNVTLLGGQAFNWMPKNDIFVGFFTDKIVVVSDKIEVFGNDNFDAETYFNPNKNLDEIRKSYSNDQFVTESMSKYRDLRVLNQDFEVTLLSFILTSHKNIKAVRKLVSDLTQKYGREIETPYGIFKTFPSAENIANASEKELRDIGAGFRAKYLLQAAQKLANEKEKYSTFTTRQEWEDYLISFTGIGEKIRDCILVFGLGFTDITPLDVWGKRVLTDFYGVDPKLSYEQMRNKFTEMFGENTSIIGQYLFEYIREFKAEKLL